MMDLIVGSFDIPVMQVYKSKSSDKNETKWEQFLASKDLYDRLGWKECFGNF